MSWRTIESILDIRASSSKLEPVVANTELFVDFLDSNAQGIQEDEASIELIADVIMTLRETVVGCYGKKPEGLTAEEDQLLQRHGDDALRTFLQLDDAYKKVGLDKPTVYRHRLANGRPGNLGHEYDRYAKARDYAYAYAALDEYVLYHGRGVLAEYLQIGSPKMLATNAVDYLLDGGQKRLIARTEAIVALSHGARTRQFASESAQALLSGIAKASQDMHDNPDAFYVIPENKELLTSLREKLEAVLE